MGGCPIRRAWSAQRWKVWAGGGLVVLAIGTLVFGGFWWGRHGSGGSPSTDSLGATAGMEAGVNTAAAAPVTFPEPPKLAPDGLEPGLRSTATAQVGQVAPDFYLFRSGGGWLRLSDYRGKVVILNFWASWCPPCQMEMPWFKSVLTDKRLPPEAVLIGVDIMEAAQTVGFFLQQGGYQWPSALDTKGEVAQAYRVSAIPTTYFISSNGTILKMHRGILPPDVLVQTAQEAVAASQKENAAGSLTQKKS